MDVMCSAMAGTLSVNPLGCSVLVFSVSSLLETIQRDVKPNTWRLAAPPSTLRRVYIEGIKHLTDTAHATRIPVMVLSIHRPQVSG